MGGRFDATKMSRPQTVVLTGISLEHTSILGSTLEEILNEKLAMIGNYTDSFFYPSGLDIPDQIIEKTARSFHRDVEIYKFNAEKTLLFENYLEFNFQYAEFIIQTFGWKKYLGKKIKRNIPGRMECRTLTLQNQELFCMYDIAHNPQAFEILVGNIRKMDLLKNKRTAVFAAMMPDKNLKSCMDTLQTYNFDCIYQITGGDFTETMLLDLSVDIQNINDCIFRLLDENQIDAILMVGSSRLYEAYIRFIQAAVRPFT